jgi:hypothetical protein
MDALVAIVGTEELKTRGMGRLIKLLGFEEGKDHTSFTSCGR